MTTQRIWSRSRASSAGRSTGSSRRCRASEALRHVLKHDFALILLDVMMPRMDGFETASLIRAREASRDTPIIFLTANASDVSLIYKAYSVGAVDYLIKPIDPDVVRAKVAVFVDLYRKTQQIRRQEQQLREAERVRGRAGPARAAPPDRGTPSLPGERQRGPAELARARPGPGGGGVPGGEGHRRLVFSGDRRRERHAGIPPADPARRSGAQRGGGRAAAPPGVRHPVRSGRAAASRYGRAGPQRSTRATCPSGPSTRTRSGCCDRPAADLSCGCPSPWAVEGWDCWRSSPAGPAATCPRTWRWPGTWPIESPSPATTPGCIGRPGGRSPCGRSFSPSRRTSCAPP